MKWNQQLIFLQEDIENRLNQLEIEKIEYIKYLNDYYDSEISNLNAEYLPRIENAECKNPINGCSGSSTENIIVYESPYASDSTSNSSCYGFGL